MQHSLSQVLGQQMRMEQRLTPQLIQSMAILQKPIADLETYVQEALENNPALELAEAEPAHDREGDEPPPPAESDGDRSFVRLDRFSRQYVRELADSAPPRRRHGRADDDHDAKAAALANTAGREKGLVEHLLEQWSLVEMDESLRAAGEVILHRLDADGYLRVRLEELAAETDPPASLEIWEQALREVQQLDPAGVGARDFVECLLLQLDRLPGDNTIERTLIQDHLHDVAQNRLPRIVKATGYPLGEIQEAVKVIRSSLHPHPGRLVGDHSAPPIRPDVLVDYAETGGGLVVRLARGNLPDLRINDDVASLAKSAGNDRETRDFARKHLEAADAIIDAVRFRGQRLLDVAGAIVEKQREFFDFGPSGLKVLRMSELAAELGCDPSTISRTVADKYMQSPRGIHPLRYFFTGGTETEEGESVGWDRVKSRLRELVDRENRRSPFNDDQLVEQLAAEGVHISRRTVAKYRAQLNIPPARLRREFPAV